MTSSVTPTGRRKAVVVSLIHPAKLATDIRVDPVAGPARGLGRLAGYLVASWTALTTTSTAASSR